MIKSSVNSWREKGAGFFRNGLSGPGKFTLQGGGGHRALFDRKERLAGFAVEDKDMPRFRDLRDRINFFPAVPHGDQIGRGGKVAIPKIVMHAGVEKAEHRAEMLMWPLRSRSGPGERHSKGVAPKFFSELFLLSGVYARAPSEKRN